MNKNKNHAAIILVFLIVFFALGGSYIAYKNIVNLRQQPEEEREKHLKNYNSRSIYVYNLTDRRVVKNLNGREKFPMASLTKLMTCRKALQIMKEKKIKLNDEVLITEDVYNSVKEKDDIMIGYNVGEKLSFKDLFYAMIMQSDDACSKSIASELNGTIGKFVKSMNLEAKKLGLKNTHYESVEGADENGQYTSTEDVCKLLKKSLKNKTYYKIFTDKEFKSSITTDHPEGLTFPNAVISKFDEYKGKDFKILGGKFGFTPKAGKSLAVLVEKNDKKYIVTTLGFKSFAKSYGHVEDVIKIMKTVGN